MQQQDLRSWVGHTTHAEDVVTERLVGDFRATLSPHLNEQGGDIAPLGVHWCLFPTREPISGLGADRASGQYPHLPPPPLPRRMWAGGEVEFVKPLRIGDKVRRTTVISDIQHKNGRTGELWFVTVEHDYQTQRGSLIRERQDIVYRAPVEAQDPASARPAAKPEVEELPLVWSVDTPRPCCSGIPPSSSSPTASTTTCPMRATSRATRGSWCTGRCRQRSCSTRSRHGSTACPRDSAIAAPRLPLAGAGSMSASMIPGDPRFHTRSNGAICMAGQASGRAASG